MDTTILEDILLNIMPFRPGFSICRLSDLDQETHPAGLDVPLRNSKSLNVLKVNGNEPTKRAFVIKSHQLHICFS